MGKVTVIIESEKIETSEIERTIHEMDFDNLVQADPEIGIYVVPDEGS
jgi:hypothetical protein